MRLLKRIFDIIGSLTIIIFTLPILIVIAFAIRINNRGPVLFFQERAGYQGRPFQIFKFRTMVVGAEKMGAGYAVEEDDQRITGVGKVLRRLSLDELPQLVNVLIGNMSIVGPRPTLPYQIERYDERQKKRLLVKPGMTGWAQINGRNTIAWSDRIDLDVWYVENWSFMLDLKIIIKTFKVVSGKRNLYRKHDKNDPISSIRPKDSSSE
jgi:lipopolysaccharide/colanic/teichoic acid biosynthesis glycosyltransferase